MARGFDDNRSAQAKNIIAIDDLRHQAYKRLTTAHMKLNPKAAFNDNAKKQDGADSMLGSIFLNMLCGGAFAAAFGHALHLPDTHAEIVPHVSLSSAFEGVSMMLDEKAYQNRARKLDLYPQGRRRDPMHEQPIKRKFNLVSGNDNARFSTDAYAEIAAMSEILDMADQLEKDGVRAVRIDENEAAYHAVKGAIKDMRKSGFKPARLVRKAG